MQQHTHQYARLPVSVCGEGKTCAKKRNKQLFVAEMQAAGIAVQEAC